MLSTLVEQHGWLVIIAAAVVGWMIFKFVRKVIFKVMGIAFTIISLIRLWSLL